MKTRLSNPLLRKYQCIQSVVVKIFTANRTRKENYLLICQTNETNPAPSAMNKKDEWERMDGWTKGKRERERKRSKRSERYDTQKSGRKIHYKQINIIFVYWTLNNVCLLIIAFTFFSTLAFSCWTIHIWSKHIAPCLHTSKAKMCFVCVYISDFYLLFCSLVLMYAIF